MLLPQLLGLLGCSVTCNFVAVVAVIVEVVVCSSEGCIGSLEFTPNMIRLVLQSLLLRLGLLRYFFPLGLICKS